jgi:hypothetical protein
MLVQPRKQISVLSLLDPEIPGGILLPDGTWGINLAAARLNFIKGLKTQISAWNNMSVGDNCKLLLNKTMVDQKTITDKIEVDKRVTLFVAPERLPSGDWELSYQITRFGQKPEPGPTIKLFVKLELPGGQDTNPDYGHSELTMAFDPPDVVRDGVDKATAEEGVLIYAKPKPGDGWLYRNCAVGDVLILAWAGKTVESEPVTQEQLDDPEGNPIVVLADEATILSAGDSDGVSVSYKIRDRVHNESEDWCEAVRIVVDTQGLRLGAPLLKQADGLIVDLEVLGDEMPLVEVWAEDVNIFKKFDEIYLSIFGTDDEGKEISELVIQRIETTPPVRVSIAHNNSTLRALAKRTVVYSYHVRRGGVVVDNSRSKSRAYSVIGEATRLAAPIAIDQISGALDPNAPEYRIRIPYDPLITPDNAIELKLFGTRSDFTIYDPELDWYFPSQDEANDPEGFIITVAGEHGKTLEGGTLRLSYNLLSDENGTITRRASLHASLLNVGKAQRELVKPIVLGEKDGALEPKDLPGGVSKITAPRPVATPTESNDIVKFFWIVEGNEPVTDFKKLNVLSKDKDVDFPLNAAFVAQHIEPNRGKKVKVHYEIFRAASNTTSYSNELEFTVGQPVALDPPTIDSVTGSVSGKEIPSDTSTTETSFKFQGKASAGLTIELRDNSELVETITVGANAVWEHALNLQPVGDHRYTVKGNYGDMPESEAWIIKVAEEEILLPPTLVKPAANPIDVLAYPNGVTVRIEYLGARKEDRARLVEVKQPAGSPQFPLVAFNANKRTNTVLSPAFLAARHGKEILLRWNLNRDGGQAAISPPLALTIQPISPEDSRLPKPQINQGLELDVTQLQASDRLTVPPWPGEVYGQRLWLRYEEVTNATPVAPFNDLVSEFHIQLPGLSRELPGSWLKTLKHGSTLKINFLVNMAGGTAETEAVLFPVRTYLIKSLVLTVPRLLDLPGPTLDFDDIADTGASIEVPAYRGMSVGQSVKVELEGVAPGYTTESKYIADIGALIFSIPRPVFIANAGRSVNITYLVAYTEGQWEKPASPPLQLNVLANTWQDSITDFNGNTGGWVFGPASRRATLQNGYYENKSWEHSGNSGVALHRTFQFKAARTYRFTYRVANINPQPDNLPPRISISTSSGLAILGVFVVPRTGAYYEQTAIFRVPASGSYTINVVSHEDRGGAANADGGNEYRIDSIYVRRQ